MEKVVFVIMGIIMNGARPHQYGVAKKTSEAPRAGMEQGVGGKKRRSCPQGYPQICGYVGSNKQKSQPPRRKAGLVV